MYITDNEDDVKYTDNENDAKKRNEMKWNNVTDGIKQLFAFRRTRKRIVTNTPVTVHLLNKKYIVIIHVFQN